jgi:methionine-rich copper-binding protein CopC
MIIDQQLMLSDGQDVTANAASDNYLDLEASLDFGAGQPMKVILTFGTVVSNATMSAALEGADDTAFSTNKITVAQGKTITPTTGTMYEISIPPALPKRYYRMYYTINGGSSPHIPTGATIVVGTETIKTSVVY